MSQYWDIVCYDCDKSAGFSINHGEDALRPLIEHRGALIGLGKMNLDICLNGHSVPLDFFEEHADHRLRLRSEYGRYDDACGETYQAGGSWPCCGLPKGHDGGHQADPKEVYK